MDPAVHPRLRATDPRNHLTIQPIGAIRPLTWNDLTARSGTHPCHQTRRPTSTTRDRTTRAHRWIEAKAVRGTVTRRTIRTNVCSCSDPSSPGHS
jgi:hypothetical protein